MMMELVGYRRRLAAIVETGLSGPFRDGRVGLEKEALRVSPAGTISAKPHPLAFGSALTHPYLTTDFSEALLELITPPLADEGEVLGFLDDLHRFVLARLEGEILWGASMPCILEGGERIPLARYGSSNAARMKTLYRRGLGYRYGRTMQVIAGVHYNFSFSEDFWTGYQALMGRLAREALGETGTGKNQAGDLSADQAGKQCGSPVAAADPSGPSPGPGPGPGPGGSAAPHSAGPAVLLAGATRSGGDRLMREWARLAELAAADAGHFRSEVYLGLVRNIQRYGWLVPYLFGASPAVCKTFVQDFVLEAQSGLVPFDEHTLYYPHATSLRLGDIGYQNRQEEGTGMKANYDSLDAYVRSLSWAISTPCPHYEAIGVKVDGDYRQLNANVLQIENEYYSSVRPKAVVDWLEKPTQALRRKGVAYIEVRSFDVNAFAPNGVEPDQLHFMAAFVRFCLLADSPPIQARERRAIDDNLLLVAHRGREPGLCLERWDGQAVALRDWALELLEAMEPVAELVDGGLAAGAGGHPSPGPCAASLARQRAKVLEPDLTPSARMLAEMRERGESFFALAQRLSQAHRRALLSRPPDPERQALLEELTGSSLLRQAQIEAADDLDFDTFLARYLGPSDSS